MRQIIAIIMLLLILAGCGVQNNLPTSPPTQTVTATTVTTEEAETPLTFTAQYIRTNGYRKNNQNPGVTVIASTQDLEDYYKGYREIFSQIPGFNMAVDPAAEFTEACSKYDDAFFQDNYLIFISLEEPSGSIGHQVTDVYRHPTDGICICIDRIVPEVGTADMAQWHIVVELERCWLVDAPNQVQVIIN